MSDYQPRGDQPRAISAITKNLGQGMPQQVLLGATGTGKTFTMAQVIQQVQRPTLVIAHNKTLAAQLCGEFKEFFPENAVSILSVIMIIISRRLMSLRPILILKRMLRLMKRSRSCVIQRRLLFLNGGM